MMLIFAVMGKYYPFASYDYLLELDYRVFVNYYICIGEIEKPKKATKNLIDEV